jgi:hypothetical protein
MDQVDILTTLQGDWMRIFVWDKEFIAREAKELEAKKHADVTKLLRTQIS